MAVPEPTTSLRLRRFTEDDAAAVRALHDLALDAVGAHAGEGSWDDDLDAIPDVYLAGGGEFLVGELNGEIVAMGALRRVSRRVAEIKRMRVAPAPQGRGFGRALLEALEARARELGVRKLHADTTVMQPAARGLYASAGYSETGTGWENGFTVVYLEKRLR